MGLNNLPGIPRPQALTALRKHAAQLAVRGDHIRIRAQDQAPLPYFVEAMFDFSLALLEAQVDWVERFIRQLEGMPAQERRPDGEPTPDPGG
jgi:hypothetical protein